MDLTRDLRTLQATYDTACETLAAARRTFDTAAAAYDARRRYAPGGVDTAAARAAWALAGLEWMTALIAREAAKDALASERRTVDQHAADHFMTPTWRTP